MVRMAVAGAVIDMMSVRPGIGDGAALVVVVSTPADAAAA
jgi:hypothetical protein